MRGTGYILQLPIVLESQVEMASYPERDLVLAVWRPRRLPYGYMWGPPPVSIPVPRPAHAPVVQYIYASFLAFHSIGALVHDLALRGIPAPKGGPWSRTTIRDILTNPVYSGRPRGTARMTRRYRLPACKPIVTRAEFLAVQRRLKAVNRALRAAPPASASSVSPRTQPKAAHPPVATAHLQGAPVTSQRSEVVAAQ